MHEWFPVIWISYNYDAAISDLSCWADGELNTESVCNVYNTLHTHVQVVASLA